MRIKTYNRRSLTKEDLIYKILFGDNKEETISPCCMDFYLKNLTMAIDLTKQEFLKPMIAIEKRYFDSLTYKKIGEQMQLTEERVRQLVAKGLRLLKHPKRVKLIIGEIK